MSEQPHISVIVPVKDEEENVLPMLGEVQVALDKTELKWELIYIDDGSSDETWNRILDAREQDDRVRALRFKTNCGQTTGVVAGVRHARAEICVTLDGDCQNDPEDIPALVAMIGEFDLVIGWRKSRSDSPWRKLQSVVANGFRNFMTGEEVHDIGCAIKAFRRECFLTIPLFEGMHRFFPTLFRYRGYSIGEHVVNHRFRTRGTTKYGMWNRVFRAFKDMLAVRWMRNRMVSYELRDEDTID